MGTSRVHFLTALVALATFTAPRALAQTATWDGSSGGWFNLNNISNGCMHWSTCKSDGTGTPGEGGDTFEVDIPSGAVTLNGGAIILNVTVGSGATLTGVTTSYLEFDSCGACVLNNAGTITFTANSHIGMTAPSLTINGGGTVVLASPSASIAGANVTLINQETIEGQGLIGLGGTAIINRAMINANASGGTLFVQSNGKGIINTGTLAASNGGTLFLIQSGGVPLNNAGGTIEALNGSTVMNAAGVITGGILTTRGTGVIAASGVPLLHNLSNTGTYVIPLSNLTTLEGTIDNTGTIDVGNSSGNGAIQIDGKVTLSGSGIVNLVDAGIAESGIHSLAAGAQLTNRNTIQGAGVIGDANLTIINQGTIIANAHDPLAFTDAGFTNTGLVRATDGATLNIFSPAFNDSGTLEVDPGATISFDGSYKLLNYHSATNTLAGGKFIVGGTLQFTNAANGIVAIRTNAANLTLTGANSQILDALDGNVLAGLATNAAGGAFTIENGRNLTSAGAFLNSGTLTVGGGSIFDTGAGGGGVYTQTGASSVTNILAGGELKAGSINWTGGALNVLGTLDPLSLSVCASCKLAGSGTVVGNVSSAGVVAPGSATAAGILSIKGAYTQGATGELVIDLAGATPGHYGVLDVSGNAALGGVVDFVATGGFHPAGGDDFTFLLFGSDSGSFGKTLFTNWSCPSGATCTEVLGEHSLSLDITGKGGGTGVPEPATWLLALMGLGWLFTRRGWPRNEPLQAARATTAATRN